MCVVCSRLGYSPNLSVVYFVGWISSKWASASKAMVDQVSKCGHIVRIVDVTNFSYPINPFKVKKLNEVFSKRHLEMTDLSSGSFSQKKAKKQVGLNNEIEMAIRSELTTKYRGHPSRMLSIFATFESFLLKKNSERLQSRLHSLEKKDSVWIYQNGRFSFQRAIKLFAAENDVPSLCFEMSMFPGKFALTSYSSHDRVLLQKDFQNWLGADLRGTIRNSVKSWIEERALPTGSNEFSRNFSTHDGFSPNIGLKSPSKTAVFFTSSSDELEGRGPEWSTFGWDSQYQAFMSAGKVLAAAGYQLVLRVHPNLARKSNSELKRDLIEIKRMMELNIFQVLGPNSSVSSYDLIECADVVIVSRSTLGIEAAYRNKKVVTVAAASYDLHSDIFKFRHDSSGKDLLLYCSSRTPDGLSSFAERWLAFFWDRDFEFDDSVVLPKLGFWERFLSLSKPMNILYYGTNLANYIAQWPLRGRLISRLVDTEMKTNTFIK